jgi:hypothetical protein
MVANGWNEEVARKTLTEQIKLQAKESAQSSSSSQQTSSSNKSIASDSLNDSLNSLFKPLKQELSKQDSNSSYVSNKEQKDMSFDVTDSSFQQLVLESDVPVIVDVYATWYDEIMCIYIYCGVLIFQKSVGVV